MAPPWLVACLLGFLALLSPRVNGQYNQDYQNSMGSTRSQVSLAYQPGPGVLLVPVVDLAQGRTSKKHIVTLVYNCHFMIEICENADKWLKSTRARDIHKSSGLPLGIFGWDFDTGTRTNRRANRKHRRRQASCPGSWKGKHKCPELLGQKRPWRHDTRWFTSDIEPFSPINKLAKDPNRNLDSGIRYICDEFPAAPWVEGGNGLDGDKPAETRCAAMRCRARHKAEQDWQGSVHNVLQQELKRIAKEEKRLFPNGAFQDKASIALFQFRRETNSGERPILAHLRPPAS